jgi:hypothetical protein
MQQQSRPAGSPQPAPADPEPLLVDHPVAAESVAR